MTDAKGFRNTRRATKLNLFHTSPGSTAMQEVLADWQPVVDEAIETLLPRTIDAEYLESYFGAPAHQYDTAAIQGALSDPVWELLDRGGKRWRAIVCLLLLDGFGADPHEYLEYACIPEILHNGTIIVDDVEDGASMRRGGPALHQLYGVDVALNAGNAMYFLPLKVIAHNPAGLNPATQLSLYDMFMVELNRTHLGQGMDICWHNRPEHSITEAHYLEMCACKTGCLGRMVARIAAILTDQSDSVEHAAAEYAEHMSIAFQIGDDILDVEHTLDQAGDFGKAFGNDIREGKKTLMVIHAMNECPADDAARLTEILRTKDNTETEILEAIKIIQSVDGLEYARDRALAFAAAARNHLNKLPITDERHAQLEAFTEFVIDRDT